MVTPQRPSVGDLVMIGREGSEDVRLLKRLVVETGWTGEGIREESRIGVVVDVETTGTDPKRDAIIELALRRFRYDAAGAIVAIDRPYSWLEQPPEPLSPEIARLTGLTDADLAGQRIDDAAVREVMSICEIVIAHNASFDRKLFERRFPEVRGLAWACSMAEIDWPGHDFDGRRLGHLLMQCGSFHDGHRAGNDVDAVIGLLRHRFADGHTALAELLENSAKPGWLVRAFGAAFAVKDRLKERGYQWDRIAEVWSRHVTDDRRIEEEAWLAAHVYRSEHDACAYGPEWREVDRHARWA